MQNDFRLNFIFNSSDLNDRVMLHSWTSHARTLTRSRIKLAYFINLKKNFSVNLSTIINLCYLVNDSAPRPITSAAKRHPLLLSLMVLDSPHSKIRLKIATDTNQGMNPSQKEIFNKSLTKDKVTWSRCYKSYPGVFTHMDGAA